MIIGMKRVSVNDIGSLSMRQEHDSRAILFMNSSNAQSIYCKTKVTIMMKMWFVDDKRDNLRVVGEQSIDKPRQQPISSCSCDSCSRWVFSLVAFLHRWLLATR